MCACPSWYQAFVSAQNQLTQPFLERCEVRDQFKERMTELYDYPKYSCPFKRGNRWGAWTRSCVKVPACSGSTNNASLLSPIGIFTFTTQASKIRVWCMCRKAWTLNPRSSWIQTLFLRTGLLLYEVWETWLMSYIYFLLFCNFVYCVLFLVCAPLLW